MKTQKRINLYLIFIGSIPLVSNGLYNPYLVKLPALYWVTELATWLLLPSAIYSYGINKKIFNNRSIGFHTSIGGKASLIRLFCICIATFVVTHIGNNMVHDLAIYIFPKNYGELKFDYKSLVPADGPFRYLILIYFSLTASFVEEFYFRGILSELFAEKSYKSQILFILLSAFLWSAIHWELGIREVFSFFILGILYALFFRLYKNIWPIVISHFLTDFIWFS